MQTPRKKTTAQQLKQAEKDAGTLAPVLSNTSMHLHSLSEAFMVDVVNDQEIPKHRREHYQRIFTVYGAVHNTLPPGKWF